MQWLNRIPLWAWFALTFLLVYATWNPTGYSLIAYVNNPDVSWSTKAVVVAMLMAVYAMYLHETYQTFNIIGGILFAGVVGTVLWKAIDWGMFDASRVNAWQWLVPGLFAFLLTVGLQGGRIWRNLTGRVPVSVDAPHNGDLHHHGN